MKNGVLMVVELPQLL